MSQTTKKHPVIVDLYSVDAYLEIPTLDRESAIAAIIDGDALQLPDLNSILLAQFAKDVKRALAQRSKS